MVREMAIPEASAVTMWDVPPLRGGGVNGSAKVLGLRDGEWEIDLQFYRAKFGRVIGRCG